MGINFKPWVITTDGMTTILYLFPARDLQIVAMISRLKQGLGDLTVKWELGNGMCCCSAPRAPGPLGER